MATAAQVRAEEGEPVTIELDPVWLGNRAYDLTGATLTAYVKPDKTTPDTDPSVTVITQAPTAAGLITVTDAVHGLATLVINGSVIPDAGTFYWRIDVTDQAGSVGTIAAGPLYVEPTGL
jgi:hypothetical protein